MINIENKYNCCGCTACSQRCPSKCINMEEDEEGFFYPIINKSLCINCNICEKVCPVINKGSKNKPLYTYAAKNKNDKIRKVSSSGGIFTILAEYVIKKNGMVVGARFDENWNVIHDFANTLEDIALFRGAKYAQSQIQDIYEKIELYLNKNIIILFSGTPCQVAGLNLFLKKKYDNLLTVDFICHGVPSPKVWKNYVNEIIFSNIDKNLLDKNLSRNINQINFRRKDTSWKKYKFYIQFSNSNVKEYTEPYYVNSFMKGFLADLYLRPSCYSCPAKSFQSKSDITIGDFWGIEKHLPDFDDDGGVSVLMINSEKGNKIEFLSKMDILSVSYNNILEKNKSLEYSASLSKYRKYFFYHYKGELKKLVNLIVVGIKINKIKNKIFHRN